MRALSVRQPFVAAILAGEKRVECRSWRTDYRGGLLLHAARTPATSIGRDLPRGGYVGVARLVDVAWDARGRFYAWRLEDPHAFPELLPAPGALSLYAVPAWVMDHIPARYFARNE